MSTIKAIIVDMEMHIRSMEYTLRKVQSQLCVQMAVSIEFTHPPPHSPFFFFFHTDSTKTFLWSWISRIMDVSMIFSEGSLVKEDSVCILQNEQ